MVRNPRRLLADRAYDARSLRDELAARRIKAVIAFSVGTSPMATNDLISLRLSVHAEEPQQVGILKAWDRAVPASQINKMGILVVTTAGIVFAVLSVENPIVLANATASLVGTSAPHGTQSMPKIQSTADAAALLPTASEAPTGDEIAVVFKTANQSQTEISQPPAEALLKQFQAWAAEEETRDEITGAIEPADQGQTEIRQPPAEALLKQFQAWAAEEETRDEITGAIEPADQGQTEIRQPPAEALLKQFQAWAAEKDARAEVRPVKNAREHVRSEHNVRAKVRRVHNARVHVRPAKNARAEVRQEQNSQAQDRSVQNVQASWPERKFGWLDKTQGK